MSASCLENVTFYVLKKKLAAASNAQVLLGVVVAGPSQGKTLRPYP